MELTISLEGITSQIVFKYVSLIMMGLAYVPQIRLSMSQKTPMHELSYASLGMLTTSGLMWTMYTYERGSFREAFATFFVTMNVATLLALKMHFYIRSVRAHYKTFGDTSKVADATV